jgi:hypothetical protein
MAFLQTQLDLTDEVLDYVLHQQPLSRWFLLAYLPVYHGQILSRTDHSERRRFYEPEAHQDLDLKISVSDLGMLRNDTHIFDFCVSKIDGFVREQHFQ